MLNYLKKVSVQIYKLYKIKKIIDKINEVSNEKYNDDSHISQFNDLKQQIFECGSLYVKFFQWYISKLKSNIANYNSNLVFNRFVHYFEDIFENCPYHDLQHTLDVFKDMMPNIDLSTYLDLTTLKVIASGSIGQIYYAKTLENQEIAIKVKHPNIDNDLNNQKELVSLIKWLQSFNYLKNKFNLFFNIDDFLYDINLQCDFNNEASNNIRFQDNFKDSNKYIIFPQILFQSRDLLISEYISGNDFNCLTEFQKSQATINFVCFFYQMLFIDNWIHGDLHCKNWKIRTFKENDKEEVQLIIYDCGICFENITSQLTRDFWFSIGTYDIDMLTNIIKKFIVSYNNDIDDSNLDNELKYMLKTLESNGLGVSIIMKSIISFFGKHNIMIHKFLLNFSILMCLVEEFLKKNDIINCYVTNELYNKMNMYNLINDSQLDVIAFTETKNCFKKVGEIFKEKSKTKYQEYNNNLKKNNINKDETISRTLFTSLEYSNLIFKPIEE
jgi:ubiquinone biosynthesis protein